MADKTLTVNGQPFTINRDRKAEVTQLTVNGQAFHIDRTAPVIDSDPVGNSRPLLGKLVGDAAAAYSLRDLNTKQGDTDVVNVRRSADNLEKIFKAKDVPTIEDWTKGKQETTLPADVATAASAYSLRKVKATYSGDAVRIRRSSDDIEVDVAFDSDDKVSASSAITNVSEQGGESGSTTATTLGDFLNESNVNVGMGTNFFAQYPQVNITGTSPTGFTATVAKTTTQDVDIRAGNQVYKNVQKGTITVSFNVQQNTFSNTVSVSLWQLVHGDGYKVIGTIPAGSTGAFSFTFENTDAVSGAIFRFSTPDHVVNDGEVLQVSDITIKASKHTALVHTWYDQTKDLTQLSTYFNSTLSSSNFGVNAMTEEFGTFFGRDNAVKLTSTSGNTQRFVSKDFGIGAGESVRFTAQIYVPSTNTALDSFAYSEKFDVGGFDRKQGVITPTQDQWVDIDFNYVQVDDTFQRIIFWNSASSTPTANNNSSGDVIYFRNMVVTRVVKGQNDAVQETAGNQPKIAENGALITKRGQPSLKFRGTDSTAIYLDSPANITANFSFFIAAQPAADGTTFSSAGNEKRNHTLWSQGATFHMAGINSDFTNGFRHGNTILSYSAGGDFNTNLNLHSLTNGSSNVDYFGNAVNKINTTNSTSTATSYDIGRKVNITSHNTRGYISEFIHYNSDQSDNRFKIESNINNYYGLYNDENDLSAAFDSNGTIPNASKDGFTADVATFSHYVNATFNNSVATGETIYVSFNAQLAPNGGTTASPILRLQNAQVGSNTSNQSSISEGFNSIDLTATGTSDRVGFLEQDDNVDYIISDFKVSRIARNGFVERLYDQSGNGRDMAQTTASNQPHIVENGVICKDSTNNPTVRYVNVGTNLGSTFLSTTAGAISSGETSLCYLTVASISTNVPTRQTFNGAGTDFSLGGTNIRLRYNGSANTFTTSNLAMSLNTNHLVVASVNSSKICTLHLDDNSETDTSAFTTNATTLNQFLGENSSSANNNNLGLQGTMSEIILYLSDQTNNIPALKANINNQYQIYS